MYYIGVDIGSTNAKLVLIDDNKNIVEKLVSPTGFSSKNTYYQLLEQIYNKNYENIKEAKIVVTGYGRVSIDNALKTVTEITCHAKGATEMFSSANLVIIDIGGQDTKIIDVCDFDVVDFIMNDKCSAGTGRFLDVMAKTLGVSISELVSLAEHGGGLTISSLCTVFAESEVISLIGSSEKKENIANAIVNSIITKVAVQASRINLVNKKVCLTGGLCNMSFICKMLGDKLNTKVESHENANFAGAFGAALICKNIVEKN